MAGIRLVRSGRQWSVHWHAFLRYRRTIQHKFDVVIDEVNTMPFFTPIWARTRAFMLIFQLAREVWWYESRFPINVLGYLAEPIYLKSYTRTPVLTISTSTENDLRRLGLQGPFTQIPIGIDKVGPASAKKADSPTFVYVGRLAPSKRVGHLLDAMARFRRQVGTGTLWLVGSGPERYMESLVTKARKLGLAGNVKFWGSVADDVKYQLMAQAHAILMASVREGWGLVVSEANACGTPAIVYDVPGLRDSVRTESTGLVVPPNPIQLSDAMIRLVNDPGLYSRLSAEALRWSAELSYDNAAKVVGEVLESPAAASVHA